MSGTCFFKIKSSLYLGCGLIANLCIGQPIESTDKNPKLSTNLYYFIGKGLQLPLHATTLFLTPEEEILSQREKRRNPYVEPIKARKEDVKTSLKTSHQQITLQPNLLSDSIKKALLSQLYLFFSPSEYQQLRMKLSDSQALLVDRDLLPDFARTHVKRFPIYRGPNCFHTAIAFSYPNIVNSDFLNPRWEKTYHPHMLNGDEILRALALGFYPLYQVQALQYGDILIFLDKSSDSQLPLHRKIKHAMVYLFSDYVFSKASKSANSPYRVEKLETEWKIWSQLPDVEIKVFRKKPVHGTTLSSFVSDDWRS